MKNVDLTQGPPFHVIILFFLPILAGNVIQQTYNLVDSVIVGHYVGTHGSVYVGGYTAATRVDNLAIMPNGSCGNTMSSYAAQNMGAGKKERIPPGLRGCVALAMTTSLVIGTLCSLFALKFSLVLRECKWKKSGLC